MPTKTETDVVSTELRKRPEAELAVFTVSAFEEK